MKERLLAKVSTYKPREVERKDGSESARVTPEQIAEIEAGLAKLHADNVREKAELEEAITSAIAKEKAAAQEKFAAMLRESNANGKSELEAGIIGVSDTIAKEKAKLEAAMEAISKNNEIERAGLAQELTKAQEKDFTAVMTSMTGVILEHNSTVARLTALSYAYQAHKEENEFLTSPIEANIHSIMEQIVLSKEAGHFKVAIELVETGIAMAGDDYDVSELHSMLESLTKESVELAGIGAVDGSESD